MPNDKPILKVLADNPALLDAVKEVILRQFDLKLTFQKVSELPNEQLGSLERARLAGINGVEDAFREIEKYKTQPSKQGDNLSGR